MRFSYSILAVLLIGVNIFSGCGQGRMADDSNKSRSEQEISSQNSDVSHFEDSSLQGEADSTLKHNGMVLISEFDTQIADESPTFAFKAYNRNGGTDFISDLHIVDIETDKIIYSVDLVKYMVMYDDPKGIPVEYYELFFVDVNFDGYKDLEIYAGPNGIWNTYRMYHIWDLETNRFINDPYDIGSLGLPSFDEKNQLIHSMVRGSAADHWYYTHKYIDGVLIIIEEISENAVWAYNLDDSTKEKVKDIVPLFDSGTLTHWIKKQLNTDTMDMVIIEEKYVLYNGGNLLEEYDINSSIGMELARLLQEA